MLVLSGYGIAIGERELMLKSGAFVPPAAQLPFERGCPECFKLDFTHSRSGTCEPVTGCKPSPKCPEGFRISYIKNRNGECVANTVPLVLPRLTVMNILSSLPTDITIKGKGVKDKPGMVEISPEDIEKLNKEASPEMKEKIAKEAKPVESIGIGMIPVVIGIAALAFLMR